MENELTEPTTQLKEQAALLRRGTLDIVPQNGLEAKLAKSARTGKPLKIKLGLDPTAPDIHLGFAVVLRKLRQFQDLGHQVIIIIGDFTALIGDPSGRSATRPMLSEAEIKENARTYVDQLARILDREKTVVRFNSEWLGALSFADLVKLTSKMTVAQVMQREDFANRYAQGLPISLHELLYPLAQAYDSVAIEADIEMGGQDQTFNILAGRDLQREEGQEPQVALFMPLLVGLDGVKKMSKSLGNYVGIAETPDVMFAKIMSIPDTLMRDYFELCTYHGETDSGMAFIDGYLREAAKGRLNPRDIKLMLARVIVAMYHDPATAAILEALKALQLDAKDYADAPAAKKAEDEWLSVHSEGNLPTEIPEVELPPDVAKDGKVWVCKLLVAAGMAKGTGEARRLIEQGGVTLDGEKLADTSADIEETRLRGAVLRVGPRRFARIV